MDTQPNPSPEPAQPHADAAAPDDDALARILAARGVAPDEITRLLATARPARTDGADVGTAPPPKPDVTVSVPVQGFEPHPTLVFPDFREASASDQSRADGLLRDAHLARRRGRFGEAAELCLTAIGLTPRDAAALEMLADVLQALGRVDDSVAAYRRAGEADPGRRTAERKYAELVLLQDRSTAALSPAAEPRNPYISVMLSALCPGAGQFYNGETAKALVLALVTLGLIVVLLWTPFGFPGSLGAVSPTAGVLMAAIGIVYVISLADAKAGAGRPRSRQSGWDV